MDGWLDTYVDVLDPCHVGPCHHGKERPRVADGGDGL
jgi:hypothetical protein